MRTKLRSDLTVALKARDRVAVAALRSALAAIDNAEAVPADEHGHDATGSTSGASLGVGATDVERRQLTAADIQQIVTREVHERSSAATEYEQSGHAERAALLRSEAAVLSRHLDSDN